MKNWILAVYHYKQCYFATITHVVDQVTDIAVVVEFLELSSLEAEQRKENDVDYCPGINSTFLAAWSITALVLYRIVSAISIYRLTKDWKRIFYQLLDFELFRTMHVNYVNESTDPCNPQRMIQSLEAVLESMPQALIQLFFVIKSSAEGNTASDVVYVSTVWSILMIASKAIREDKLAFYEPYQTASLDKTSCKNILMYPWIKRGYILRAFYRLADVMYRLSVALLIWLFLGGFELIVLVCCECAVLFFLCWKTKELRS